MRRRARAGIRLAAIVATLQLGACAVAPGRPETCDTAGAERPPYTLLAGSAPRTSAAAAVSPHIARYRLTLDERHVSPCAALRLHKELTLLAPARPRPSIWEIQDFFAGNGTFIARHTEDVSEQLTQSGRYARDIVLPVPASTPSGRYRIVSRLIVKENGRESPLASAATEFRVRPAPISGNRARPKMPH